MISNKNIKGGFLIVLFLLASLVLDGCAKQAGSKESLLLMSGKLMAPSHLSYATTSAVYTLNEPIQENVPSVTGVVTDWSVDPELPAGLEIDSATGVISGNPGILQTAAHYTVTARNDYGSANAVISIAVNLDPPAALSYSTTACVYTKDEAIADNTPTVTGTVTSWSIHPALPGGLTFDTATGVISGTPDTERVGEIYTVTASNDYGSTSADISITVNLEAPTALSYTTTSCVYTKDEVITANTPIVSGTVTSWSAEPELPSGLTLHSSTGVISGIPDMEQPAEEYTITARNSGGETTTILSITVNLEAPAALSYATTACVYTEGLVIADNIPTVTGTVTSWTVEPELPHGLTLNTATGVISGTPDTGQAAVEYTITAANSGGSVSTPVSIAVNLAPPSALSYATTACVYTKGEAITGNVPTVTGTVTSWSVSPDLPGGLVLGSDGVISGTPDTEQTALEYTITATNTGGSVSTPILITVNLKAPAALNYTTTACVYTKDLVIANNTPTVTGTVTSWSVDPALPHGLTLNTTTGVISGTPDTEQTPGIYTITATNSGGSATADISITVNLVAPTALSYTTMNAVYTKYFAIEPNTPIVTGTVRTWTADPALPGGLVLGSNGVISGTPEAEQAAETYTITATNSGGSVSVDISIAIEVAAPPTNLSYSMPTAVYTVGAVITPNTPTITGAATSWTSDPALPAGLILGSNGVISGTPEAEQATTVYTIRASNYSGYVETTITMTVNYAAPTGLSYTTPNAEYTIGFVICNNRPLVTGTVTSWSVDKTLPAGLVLNTTTGVISGTPTTLQAADTYTITGTNSGGSATTTVSIAVVAKKCPRFAYVANGGDNTVSIYTANGTTGQLRHNGYAYIGANTGPRCVAADPSRKFLYVANYTNSTISVYSINQTNGTLTLASTASSATSPCSIVIDPRGRFAYVTNLSSSTVRPFTIDQTTGALTAGTTAATGSYPYSVAVDPSGRFVYVANYGSSTVSVYTINQTTGALTAGTAVATGTAPYSVTVDPSGRFVYTANYNSNNVSVFTIDQATGALTAGTAVAAGTNPRAVTVDPSSRFAYVANYGSNTVSVYTINQTTGALTAGAAVSAGTQPVSVAIDSSGQFAYVANYGGCTVSVYTINQTTGALTAASAISARLNPYSVSVVSGSAAITYVPKFAYVANRSANTISSYTINQTTGALTSVGTTTTPVLLPNFIANDPKGRFIYTSHYGGTNNATAFTINQTTGALTAGTSATAQYSYSIAVDPSGRFAFTTNTITDDQRVTAFSIDQTTGALTSVNYCYTGISPWSIAVDPSGRFVYSINQTVNTDEPYNLWVYTINPSTGALATQNLYTIASTPRGITVDPSGRFVYVANGSGSVSVYTINLTNGSLTSGSTATAGTTPYCIAIDPLSRFAYVANNGANTVSVFTVNQTTGALTVGTAVTCGSSPMSVTVDASGNFVYVSNNNDGTVSMYTINQTTGALSGGTTIAAGTWARSITSTGVIQ